jgi:hypothetical protein
MLLRCLNEPKQKAVDIFGFSKAHEVYVLMNQAARQSEVPTSGYGRITEGCTC